MALTLSMIGSNAFAGSLYDFFDGASLLGKPPSTATQAVYTTPGGKFILTGQNFVYGTSASGPTLSSGTVTGIKFQTAAGADVAVLGGLSLNAAQVNTAIKAHNANDDTKLDFIFANQSFVFNGGSGNDVFSAGKGADVLNGGAGADTLKGLAGKDVLNGGTGNDTLAGGLDDDTYYLDSLGDKVIEGWHEGTDTVHFSVDVAGTTYALTANVENLVLAGATAINGKGTELDNVLTGNSAKNVLTGGGGNDVLDGKGGGDKLIGGTGNDIYWVDDLGDSVVELANQGKDEIRSSLSYSLANLSHVENLTLLGAGNLNATGNGLNNIITGNAGNNILIGGGGSDTLNGGGGDDKLTGGTGNDALNGGGGGDIAIYSGASSNYKITTQNGVTTVASLLGTDGTDTLTGIEKLQFSDKIINVGSVKPPPPLVPTLTLAAASDTGVVGDGITADTTPTLIGTAAAGAVVTVSDGGTVLGAAVADVNGSWTFTTGVLASGVHNFTASTNAGTSAPLALTIAPAAQPVPTLTLAAASDTGVVGDGITADTTPTLIGTAEAGAVVTVSDGGTVIGTAVANVNGSWTFTTGVLASGAHNFTASTNAGTSPVLSLSIDMLSPFAPTLALAAASDTGVVGDGITADTTPTLIGTAEAGSTVTVTEGATVLGTAVAAANGSWSFTTGVLAVGAHSLSAFATDAAGNQGSAVNITVTIAADNPPPASSFNLTVNNDVFIAASGGSVVTGTQATLNPGDSLTGGAGVDVLNLSGPGVLHIDTLASFTGFEEVNVSVSNGPAVVYLGSQSLAFEAVNADPTNSSFVQVFTGTGQLSYSASGFNSVNSYNLISVVENNWHGANVIDGANSLVGVIFETDNMSYDLTDNAFADVETLSSGAENQTFTINSAVAAGIENFIGFVDSTLTTSDAQLDLSNSNLIGITVVSTNASGTVFTLSGVDDIYEVYGGPGQDTIVLSPSIVLTTEEIDAIFSISSIETVIDGNGQHTAPANLVAGSGSAKLAAKGSDLLSRGMGDTFDFASDLGSGMNAGFDDVGPGSSLAFPPAVALVAQSGLSIPAMLDAMALPDISSQQQPGDFHFA